ncbi:MAG: 23S rRNA (cytosine(1962)-C(5))-methyltransferase RlmI [Candidatus Eisenbacteria bacterium]|nr:23S rRNA (cytosine(1962)-C(5))-methyltransferase RlmI [Candidatus Eisenbacteria bacterium]
MNVPAPIPPMPGEPAPLHFQVRLRAGRQRSVHLHHPWIYSGAVAEIEGHPEARAGDLGRIVSATGEVLGIAMVHPEATLVARMLVWGEQPIGAEWVRARVADAAAWRAGLVEAGWEACRLINAEGDGLPGLIVDRYGDWLVVQCLTRGMVHLQPWWLPALLEAFQPRGLLERPPRGPREAGLERQTAALWGALPPATLLVGEAQRRYLVDLLRGQKTGFYLDQRENRSRVGELARGRRVLDAYAYTGGFAVAAGVGGAREVVAIESSPVAAAGIREHWTANHLPAERLEVVRGSVPRVLRSDDRSYDLIVLDPPPFSRRRGHREHAARAYKDVNLWALRRLRRGGLLVTFSCSQQVGGALFQKIVFAAASDAGLRLQWVARLGAARDHPVHLDHPQGEYLTGLLLRALEGGA